LLPLLRKAHFAIVDAFHTTILMRARYFAMPYRLRQRALASDIYALTQLPIATLS